MFKLINTKYLVLSMATLSTFVLILSSCSLPSLSNPCTKLSDDERILYIHNYLCSKYDDIGILNINEVEPVYHSGKFYDGYYSTSVTDTDGNHTTVHVNDDGTITDDRCLIQIKEDLTERFTKNIQSCIADFKIEIYTNITNEDYWDGKITYEDDDAYLADTNNSTLIDLYIPRQNSLSEQDIINIKTEIGKNRVSIYVFYVDNINNIDTENDNRHIDLSFSTI